MLLNIGHHKYKEAFKESKKPCLPCKLLATRILAILSTNFQQNFNNKNKFFFCKHVDRWNPVQFLSDWDENLLALCPPAVYPLFLCAVSIEQKL